MRGNSQVRFLGEGPAARLAPYPTCDMKVAFQIVQHESFTIRELNPWFRPRESSGTGATGNGRVRSCRNNVKRLPATGGCGVRLKGKSNTSELGHTSLLLMSRSCCKALPKGKRSKLSPEGREHTDICAAGVLPGTNPFVFGIRNMENPLTPLFAEGKHAARPADETAGMGSWRKQRPFCNRMDKSLVALCESRPTSSRLCIARALEEPQQEESK